MSLSDQITNFHNEVSKGRTRKTVSNMNKFRKFLFRNQGQDFTERDRTKLSSIVQLYFTQLNREYKITVCKSDFHLREEANKQEVEEEDGTKPSALPLIEGVN
jgi:hypothetical protein